MSTPPSPQSTSMDGSERTESASLHPQFDALDADIAIISSDSTVFRVYRKNVDIIMGNLPVGGGRYSTHVSEIFGTEVAVYKLHERRDVLENVLQFLYRRKHTFPANLTFELLMEIAESAEKYEVSAAVLMCEKHIRKHIPSKPTEILAYALKYNHTELVDEAALNCVVLPLRVSIRAIPFTVEQVEKWILYREEWLKIFKDQRAIGKGTCQRHYQREYMEVRDGDVRDYVLRLEEQKSLPKLRKKLAQRMTKCDSSCRNSADLNAVNDAITARIDRFPAFTTFGDPPVQADITSIDYHALFNFDSD